MSALKTFVGVLLLAAFTAANSVVTDDIDCPQVCPALYAPVCATDGKLYKEFSNLCELKTSNCRRQRSAVQPYMQADMFWCSSEFVENLYERLGNLDLTKPECLKPCALIYAPVCVSNGVLRGLVSNECMMDTYNCVLGSNADASTLFKVLKHDSC